MNRKAVIFRSVALFLLGAVVCITGAMAVPGQLNAIVKAGTGAGVTKQVPTAIEGDWCATEKRLRRGIGTRGTGDCPTGFAPDVPATRNANIPTGSTPIKVIRLRFHLFANNDGSNAAATQADVTNTVAQMNADYAPARIQFSFTWRSVNDTQFASPADPDVDTTDVYDRMKDAYAQSPATQLNVFVTNIQQNPATPNTRTNGFATFPWDADGYTLQARGGIVMNSTAVGAFGAGSKTMSHEVGHCFGLWHVHRGTVSDGAACSDCWYEPVGRSATQGDLMGDLCSDTQPTIANNACSNPVDNPSTPANESIDSCSGQPWSNTPFNNLMGYAPNPCRSVFTPQQRGRMHAWINEKLTSWVEKPTITVSPVDLHFDMDYDESAPVTKTFTIRNTGAPGTTLNWSIAVDPLWGGYPSWITSVTPTSGTTTTETDTITVTATRPDSVYAGRELTIRITDLNASNPEAFVIAHMNDGEDYVYTGLAATCTGDGCEGFIPGDPSDWNLKANWGFATGGPADDIPGPDDRATINGYTVYVPTVTVKALRLRGADLRTVNQVQRTITVTDTFEWEAGSFTDCDLKLPATCQSTIGTSGAKAINANTIYNAGTVDCTGADIGYHDTGPSIINEPTGVWKVRTAMDIRPVFLNNGRLEINVVSGSNPVIFSNIFSSNKGGDGTVLPVVDVQAGKLQIDTLGSFQDGVFQAAAGATLDLHNNDRVVNFLTTSKFLGAGTLILNGNRDATLGNIAGTLTVGDTATPASPCILNIIGIQHAASGGVILKGVSTSKIELGVDGADFSHSIALYGPSWTIPAQSSVDAVGGVFVQATSLINQGLFTVKSSGMRFAGANTTFTNSGILQLQMDNNTAISRDDPTNLTTLNNIGIINKSNPNTNEISPGIKVVSSGYIGSTGGILRFRSGLVASAYISSFGGELNATANSFIELDSTLEQQLNNTLITGAGRVRIINANGLVKLVGTVTAGQSSSGGTLQLQGGALTGTSTSKITGPGFLWTGGLVTGQGYPNATNTAGYLNIDANGVMTIDEEGPSGTFADKYILGSTTTGAATINNAGTVNWKKGNVGGTDGSNSGQGPLSLFNNTGTFNAINTVAGASNFNRFFGLGSDTVNGFVNTGIINKSGVGVCRFDCRTSSTGQIKTTGGILELSHGSAAGTFNAGIGSFIDIAQTNITSFKFNDLTFSGLGRTRVQVNGVAQQEGNLVAGTTPGNGTLELLAGTFIGSLSSKTIQGPNLIWSGSTITDRDATPAYLNIASGAVLKIDGNDSKTSNATIQNSGTINWNDGILILTDTLALSNLSGGTFNALSNDGMGTAQANGLFRNAGILNLGSATTPYKLSTNGGFEQTATGKLNVKIAGTNANTPQFDRIELTGGTIKVGGTLNVKLLNNYVPPPNTQFQILGHGTRSGTFATLEESTTDDRFFKAIYNVTDVTLAAYDVTPTISGNDVTVTEGDSGTVNATFTVSLSSQTQAPVTVKYATQDVNAVAPGDYTALPLTTLTFAAGETSKNVTVQVKADLLDEVNETFRLNLSAPTGGATIADSQGIGTIGDDDAVPSLSINDIIVMESNAGSTQAAFTLTLSAPSGRPITINAQTASGGSPAATSGADYNNIPPTLITFNPGQTTRPVNVTVLGDIIDEADEKFVVNLAGAVNATVTDTSGICTILDNDLPPSINVSAPNVTEGTTGGTAAMTFTISLSAASARNISVQYQTANAGTFPATAGADYNAVPVTTVIFLAGETTKTVNVTVKGDILDEDNERIKLNLTNPVNATVGTLNDGIIVDDDATPSLSINDRSLVEGNSSTSQMVFTVTLSAASGRTVTVYAQSGSGGSPAATAGTDYVALPQTLLTFTPGQTTKTVSITLNGDTAVESDEKFVVNLSGYVNAAISDNSGQGLILNDDAAGAPLPQATDKPLAFADVSSGSATTVAK